MKFKTFVARAKEIFSADVIEVLVYKSGTPARMATLRVREKMSMSWDTISLRELKDLALILGSEDIQVGVDIQLCSACGASLPPSGWERANENGL